MAKECINGISIEEGKVFINSKFGWKAGTNKKYENENLTQIYKEKGIEGVFAKLGEEYWKGNILIRDISNKLCIAIVSAIEWLPEDINKEDFDAKVIGNFIGKAATRLEKDRYADLSKEADELFALMKY